MTETNGGSTTGVADRLRRYAKALKAEGAIRSEAVERAFLRVERHRLLERFYVWPDDRGAQGEPQEVRLDPKAPDPDALEIIYSDRPLVTELDAEGRPISSTSQPWLVARMLELLELAPGMRVLEIGAGTGYNAALIAEIVGRAGLVVTLDVQPRVVERARRLLDRAGYGEIRVLHRDGAQGAPEFAPFDRLVATVGCPDVSWSWAEQLTPDGEMLIPLQHGAPHVDPLVCLRVRREGRNVRLEGRVVDWSGFMLAQGELGRDPPWPLRPLYPPERTQGPPDREHEPLPELPDPEDRYGWFGLHYFWALCEPRITLGWSSGGQMELVDGEGSVLRIGPEGLKLWGNPQLYERVRQAYERWRMLGRPKLTDWRTTFLPKGEASNVQADERRGRWVLRRARSVQIVYLERCL